MIISESKKFVFIHNPKCAGTSVRFLLEKFDTRANFYWGFAELDGKKVDKAHMPVNILRRFSLTDFDLLNSYFVFGFVRNPYSRIISSYNEQHIQLYNNLINGNESISSYQIKLNDFIKNLKPSDINGWNIKYRHFVRQTDMFYLGEKCIADLVFKVENFDDSYKKIELFLPSLKESFKNKINIKKNSKPVKIDFLNLLSTESIDIINKLYNSDFIIFDYQIKQI